MKSNIFLVLLLLGIFQSHGINSSSGRDTNNVYRSLDISAIVDTVDEDQSDNLSFFEELNEEEEENHSRKQYSKSSFENSCYTLSNGLKLKYTETNKANQLLISFPHLYIIYQVFRI